MSAGKGTVDDWRHLCTSGLLTPAENGIDEPPDAAAAMTQMFKMSIPDWSALLDSLTQNAAHDWLEDAKVCHF